MKLIPRALALASLLLAAPAQASTLDVNLNGDVVRGAFAFPAFGNLTADVGLLHHQDDGDVIHFGLHLVDEAGAGESLIAGLGGRVVALDATGLDGQVIALGGFFRYTLPDYNRVGFSGHLYFGPDVIAFGDTSRYFEVAVRAQYNVLRQGHVYLGYRNIKADFELGPEVTIDSGLHVGLLVEF